MRTMLRTAIAALSFAGIGPAFADEGDAPNAISYFSSLPGVTARAPVQNAAAVATAQNRQAAHIYATRSNQGTWVFQGSQNQGANS